MSEAFGHFEAPRSSTPEYNLVPPTQLDRGDKVMYDGKQRIVVSVISGPDGYQINFEDGTTMHADRDDDIEKVQ